MSEGPQRRLVGHLNDAAGDSVAISARRDEVLIRQHGTDIRLGPGDRHDFRALFWQASREAAAWTREHAGDE